jgi:hypothetical protein
MASRWFVFWIACWVIAVVKGWEVSGLFLILAAMTGDPAKKLKEANHVG